MKKNQVYVSGYYGFENLGDEAILEEICRELKQIVSPEQIVILSIAPEKTAEKYGVRSMQRKSLLSLWAALGPCCLFISGGGGLFQNTRSLGSIIFYGLQILMAKAFAAQVCIYAQGIGPLRGKLAENLCQQFFSQADHVLVRDDVSMKYLQSWGIRGERTADPVWNLEASELPADVQLQLDKAAASTKKSKCIGLSLRPSADLTDAHLMQLADGLQQSLQADDNLLLLPLQAEQDLPVLQSFQNLWNERGRKCTILDASSLVLPSQWAGVFAQLKWLVAMRLHALIFALKAGRPVAGIAYDPKVTQLLAEFEQECLILTKETQGKGWAEALQTLASSLPSYSARAESHAASAKKLACQNFAVLARILNMPRS